MTTAEFGTPRTAIVTGGARRIGAELARALAQDGWHLVIHHRSSEEEAKALAAELGDCRTVEAELGDPAAAATILAAARDMPPLGLLVNSASGFAYDALEAFTATQWDQHLNVNLRAPALLTQAFAAAVPAGSNGLIVNLLDAKLAQPNPDFFSYTISKMGLAGLTELSARALAGRGIRVCGIAPSVTLVSGPQSRENFEQVHAMNALRRGVRVEEIVAALRFIVAVPSLTGQVVMLDGGQRFLALPRDVQFMET